MPFDKIYAVGQSPVAMGNGSVRRVEVAGSSWMRYEASSPVRDALIPDPVDVRAIRLLANHPEGISFSVLHPDSEPMTQKQLEAAVGYFNKTTTLLPFVKYRFDGGIFDALPNLKEICHYSTGYNNTILDDVRARSLPMTFAPGPLTSAMAEITMGMLMDAHFGLTGSVTEDLGSPVARMTLESLATKMSGADGFSQVLLGLMLTNGLRLKDMYELVTGGRFVGCGVGAGRTVPHRQFATDEKIGVNTPVAVMYDPANAYSMRVADNLARYLDAFGVRDRSMIKAEDIDRVSDGYLIRTPFVPDLSGDAVADLTESYISVIDPLRAYTGLAFERLLNRPVSTRDAGIAGVGRIGLEIARRCLALGMPVTGHDTFISQAAADLIGESRFVDKDTILGTSTLVMMMTYVKGVNDNWLGSEELKRRPDGSIDINNGRGQQTDEAALYGDLSARPGTRAYYSDVMVNEAEGSRNPLVALANFHGTGHTGSCAAIDPRKPQEGSAVRFEMQRTAIEDNLFRLISGLDPMHPVP